MARIKPFKALRPVRDKVHLVATRPYYSYKKNVLHAKLGDNPFSMLHIINPEFGLAKKTKPNSKERFEIVLKQFALFEEKGVLIRDNAPHIYVYRQSTPKASYTGFIAGADAEEYLSDHIKKHESTLTERKNVFTKYLDIVGYNAEPVLLSYPKNKEIESLLKQVSLQRPEYEFSTTDCIKHELWTVEPPLTDKITEAFEKVPALYIADGHHRCASSVALYQERKAKKKNLGMSRYFLSFFVSEESLQILEFQRLVTHLNHLDKQQFLTEMSLKGQLLPLKKARKPKTPHEITFYVDGSWYCLHLNEQLFEESHPTDSLDAAVLTKSILHPILGIEDLKTTKEVEFIPGNVPLKQIENQINQNKFKVAFLLFPVSFEAVRKVADFGMNMPPKTTYIEPKLRSGLTILDINHDTE